MNPSSLLGHVLELIELIDTTGNSPADRTAATFFRERKYLGSRDRRFIADTVFSLIRNRRYLEALLERFVEQHPTSTDLDAKTLRYLSLSAIYFATLGADLFEIPSSLWKIRFPSIDQPLLADWAKEHKSLEFLEGNETVRLGVRYSFQDWMVDAWKEKFGESTESLLQSLNMTGPTTLRVNTLKTDRASCQQRLKEEGVETEATPISPDGLTVKKRFNAHASPTFKDGWYEMQDEGSQLVSLLSAPKPGELVIDACAGAGGKALHLAALMKNEGEIVAIDVERRRLVELGDRVSRAGIRSVRPVLHETLTNEQFVDKADLVLVDAPCTGVGTIRRNPALKWSVSEGMSQHYAEKQQIILDGYARFVKPGGRLIYVTCSLLPKENEGVITAFQAAHPQFSPLTGPNEFSLPVDGGLITLTPHNNGTDGFFIAMMQRQ